MHLLSGKGGCTITQPKIFWHDTVLFPFINDTDKFTRYQNSIGPLGTVSHQYIMLSIAAVHSVSELPYVYVSYVCVKFHVCISCVIKVRIQIIWINRSVDMQFATMVSKSPTAGITMASNSLAADKKLALRTILAEIDGTVRYVIYIPGQKINTKSTICTVQN